MSSQEKYPLTSLVERQVVLASCKLPRFFSTIGYALSPEMMPTAEAGLAVQAAQTLSKKSPCTSIDYAIQQVRWRVQKGQITQDQLDAVEEYLQTSEDVVGTIDVESLIATVQPIVQRALQKVAVESAIKDFGKGVPVEKSAYEFQKVAAVGEKKFSLGHEGLGEMDDILEAASSTLENPLPTGIMELDSVLGGGLEQYALGLVMGNSGDGKSLFLSSVASTAIMEARDTAYITLELGEAAIRQRIYCNLLGMSPGELKDNPKEAVRRYGLLQKRPEGLGRWVVCYMSPKVTTPADIRAWLDEMEREKNFRPEVLAVDYADHMVGKVGKEKRSYDDMKEVYNGIRDIAAEEKRIQYLWTASQTRNRSDRKKRVGLEDASDSTWKIRIADLVVAIERSEEDCANDEIRFRVPKRRNGQAHAEVGPIPMDAGRWRITTTNRSEPW